jgi:hypothetical protein
VAKKKKIAEKKGRMSFKDRLVFDTELKNKILVQVKRVWELYQQNLEQGMDEDQSIKQALEIGIPQGKSGWDDREEALRNWKFLELWPPSLDQEDESD